MDERDLEKCIEPLAISQTMVEALEHVAWMKQQAFGAGVIPPRYLIEEEKVRAEVRQLLHGAPDPDKAIHEMQAMGLDWWQMRDFLARGEAKPMTLIEIQAALQAMKDAALPVEADEPKRQLVKAWSTSPKTWAHREAPAPPKVMKPRRR